jgi:hypothetical protein
MAWCTQVAREQTTPNQDLSAENSVGNSTWSKFTGIFKVTRTTRRALSNYLQGLAIHVHDPG